MDYLETKEEAKLKRNFLEDGAIIVGIASVFSYFIAFLYEVGYATYFGIPAELVSVKTENIFLTLSTIGLVIFPIHALVKSGRIGIFYSWPGVAGATIAILSLLFFSIGIVPLFNTFQTNLDLIRFVVLGFALYTLLYVMSEVFGPSLRIRISDAKFPVVNVADRHINPPLIIWACLAFFTIALAAGWANAKNQDDFLTVTKEKEISVVLGISGDKMILRKVDENSHEVIGGLFINEISTIAKDGLEIKKIGPLKAE